MYASATCSTSHFLPQTAKRFDSVSFAAFRLRCPAKRFDSVSFAAFRLRCPAKRFDSVSFAAFRLRCPGCRNSVAFEFRVIPLEHAYNYLDEAHSIGAVGKTGRGVWNS
ncbi:hypothetical protein NC653_007795 [Populus alba x Populus x berolinensis]|uniref:Uncharacterized protein n=1 Tax=Populus alba x Populus x berolinensis TaxID=444605 RepID=A0AAD6R5A8_9ROSI|nr:hypothetical protein NC653_007795 [Populus alba x Populus x berolinensis]